MKPAASLIALLIIMHKLFMLSKPRRSLFER
jgi:hypothetical protein